MEELHLDGSEFQGHTMMCPDCGLPLYQKDKMLKFFLFSCRACQYEVQLDHEFSWETSRIKKSILPTVRQQHGNTCDPNAIVTAVESGLRFQYAKKDKVLRGSLSADDLAQQHEKYMGPGFTWDSNQEAEMMESRTDILRRQVEKNGVMTEDDFKFKKQSGTRYRAKSKRRRASFADSSKMILQGSLLHTSIYITEKFDSLDGDEIYISDKSKAKVDHDESELKHAIVLVGFGVKDNVQYFRFMNSHGRSFGKDGFGCIRAQEISIVISFKPSD